MARGNYNGFTPEDQKRGGQIQTTAYGNGMLVRKWECRSCRVKGKVPGDIIAHLEDYSDPIEGAIWLCYRCHTVLHARFDHPKGWDAYRTHIRMGTQWPLVNSYARVLEMHCKRIPHQLPPLVNPKRVSTILDEIEEGLLYPDEAAHDRMKQIHEMGIKFFRQPPQDSLF